MPASARHSLFLQYPLRVDVPVLMVVAAGGLVTALNLPFMVIDKFVFWKDEYSLFTSMRMMWTNGYHILAAVIFLFSIIFPYVKLIALTVIWFYPMAAAARKTAIFWLSMLGKWSMLDVFVLALLIVLLESKHFVKAEPRPGVYVFAGAILVSMVVSLLVERVCNKEAQRYGD